MYPSNYFHVESFNTCIPISPAEMSLQSHWIAPNCNSSEPFCPSPWWNSPPGQTENAGSKIWQMPFFNWIFITFPFRRLQSYRMQSYRNNLITGNQESVSPSKDIYILSFIFLFGRVKIFGWNVFKFFRSVFLWVFIMQHCTGGNTESRLRCTAGFDFWLVFCTLSFLHLFLWWLKVILMSG